MNRPARRHTLMPTKRAILAELVEALAGYS